MKRRVYIQYNCVAHYRIRIFELLTQNSDYEFTVVADKTADTPFLATISELDNRHIRQIEATTYQLNLPKLPVFYFQPRAVWKVLIDKPDLIIALGSPYSITAWMLLLVSKIIGRPLLLWGHGLLGDERGMKWWIRRVFYKMSSGQLLYGEYAEKLLIERGFPADTLHVVYNSLDYDNQVEIYGNITDQMRVDFRDSLGLKATERLIVFTGRLQPVKRLDMIIDAMGLLKKKQKIVHAAFVGEGQEKNNLMELARDNDVEDQVHFLGASYDESYLGLVIGSSDLCVIPSGAGLSIMHSMVFGTPVLIHNKIMCHFPEWEAVVENVTGLFYQYGSISDLANKMQSALYPEPIKNRLEANCRKMIEQRYNPHNQEKIFVDAVTHHIS